MYTVHFTRAIWVQSTNLLRVFVITLRSEVGLGSGAFGGWHFQYKSTAKRETEKMRRTKRMKVKVRALFSSRKKSSVATRMSI